MCESKFIINITKEVITLSDIYLFNYISKYNDTYFFLNKDIEDLDLKVAFIKLFLKGKDNLLIGSINLLNKINQKYFVINPNQEFTSAQTNFICQYDSKEDKIDYEKKIIYLKHKYISPSLIIEGKSFSTDINILNYIVNYKLFFAKKVSSLISEKRYRHVISVANLAYNIAICNYLDPHFAFMAGFYHDIAKNEDLHKKYFEIVEREYSKYFPHNIIPKYMYHQFLAEYVLKENFNITSKKLVDAIKFHTSGNKKMTSYAKIIYAADKIEPLRNFDATELYNSLLINYKDGFIKVLQANREYLLSQGDKDSNDFENACYKEYLKRSKN